ncbi:tRNA dihydrouridine synthase DusB [Rickettsia endosymbiont of Cardiosporidium cionae]|uniref:tRNA dihydrouridine synthase DusB n=1 Tax=Rickettsia endosymbiont of Cardiosporidium cionae TaxID=2777155 RepID=UPI0018942B1A|nr:tRNA dihydrouridine synthase DusB [Rickettsia endosymbiont of Cardiosporidium cionae]KAF8818916.1 tRNA-dihydrouridine synthase [Rickettsia endosymbiont of Cardiosporidium cionae]
MIRIANLVLSSPVILAPMSGITDLPYRMLVKKIGAGLVVSEMVASRAMINNASKALKKAAIIKEEDSAACVQLAGCEAKIISEAAKLNQDAGAKIIDLNFGCPAKKITNGYAGSALMKDEKLATEIFENTVKAVNIPVTLKMRLGWDENNKNVVKLSKIAENSGIKMITVHARTRSQFFSGVADWAFVKNVVEQVKTIPVIINGDIKCFDTAKRALSLSKAAGVMIGRGCYGKPWLLSQIDHFIKTGHSKPDPTLHQQFRIVLDHYNAMIEYHGSDVGLKIARKHLAWYSSGLKDSAIFRATINKVNNPDEVKNILVDFYSRYIV